MVNISGSGGGGITPWVSLAGVVVGAVLGGGFTWWTSRNLARRAEKKEARALRVARLEEIHEAIGTVRRTNAKVFVAVLNLLRDGTPFQVAAPPPPHDRLHTLISLYAPDLEMEYAALMKVGDEYQDVLMLSIRTVLPNLVQRQKWDEDISRLGRDQDLAYIAIQKKAAEQVRRELGPPA